MLHLDDATIFRLLDLPSVTERVAAAYAFWDEGHAATTPRVRAVSDQGMASAMAAVVPPYTGGKVYATAAGRFTFVVVLFDLDGGLLCTLDGDALTRLRTPATAAVALRRLAAPGAAVAAVLGTGRQAWGHLAMLRYELPDLVEVRVHGRRAEAVATLVDRATAAGIPAKPAESADAAVDGADVVVTVTSAHEPLFTAEAVGDRTLICAMGATKPDRAEIGPDVVERCVAIVTDDLTGSRHECGDLIRAAAAGRFDWDRAVDLHAVVSGAVTVPRAGAGPVLFEAQGVALQDVAAAGLAWERHHTPIAPLTPPPSPDPPAPGTPPDPPAPGYADRPGDVGQSGYADRPGDVDRAGHPRLTAGAQENNHAVRGIEHVIEEEEIVIVTHRLSLAEAEIAADAALATAAELGVGSVVCVCDAGGFPIVVKRADNGKVTSVDIAIAKAFTAAGHRRPTHTYTNAQPNQEAFGIMNMHGGRFTIFVGGWPIEVQGEVVGGIGVSGGHTKEDIACCQAGITALLEHLGEPVDFSKWDGWRAPDPQASEAPTSPPA